MHTVEVGRSSSVAQIESVFPAHFPYFGSVHYDMRRSDINYFSDHPKLMASALRFKALLDSEFRSPRFTDFDLDDSPFSERPRTKEQLDQIFEDVSKWAAFEESRARSMILLRDNKFYMVSDGILRSSLPFNFSKTSTEAAGVRHLDQNGRKLAFLARAPADWHQSQWALVAVASEENVMLGEPRVVSQWRPTEQQWAFGDDSENSLEAPILDALTSLRRYLSPEPYSVHEGELDPRFGKLAQLRFILLGWDCVVQSAPSGWWQDLLVSKPDFSKSIARYEAYRAATLIPQVAEQVRILANPALCAGELLSIEPLALELFDTRLSVVKDQWSRDAKLEPEKGLRDRSLTALGRIHGITFSHQREKSQDIEATGKPKQIERDTFAALSSLYARDPRCAVIETFPLEHVTDFTPTDEGTLALGATAAQDIDNLPYYSVMEAAIAFRPSCEPLMRQWREIWDRSFPGWRDMTGWGVERCEKSKSRSVYALLKREVASKQGSLLTKFRSFDNELSQPLTDLRDYRCHIIDNADSIISMRHLKPFMGIADVCGKPVVFTGNDEDGLPRFDLLTSSFSKSRLSRRLTTQPDYWNWPGMGGYMKRKFADVANVEEGAGVLLSMAFNGHSHAFVKVTKGKGTWTVALGSLKTIEQAKNLLGATIAGAKWNWSKRLLIQEHVPFKYEQRYYVVDGHLIGSACSDRNFSVVDASGKRLDHRVACLLRPSIDHGEYDRGKTTNKTDRKLSALFAREARRIASELRQHGILEYSLDMGMTDRGPMCIEANELDRSGPYNLRREIFMRAFERKRQSMALGLKGLLLDAVRDVSHDPKVLLWSADLIERNADRLSEVLSHQYDTDREARSGKNNAATYLIRQAALSIILTAMLEQPIPTFQQSEIAA